MSHPPALQPYIDDELSRAVPMAERIHAGALQLLRDSDVDAAEALNRRAVAFRDRFVLALRERAAGPGGVRGGAADGLALLDESQIQVDIEISRTMQLIDTTAEWELRELSTFTSTLAGLAHVQAGSNPLGPSVYAGALWDATEPLGGMGLRTSVNRVAAGVLAGLLRNAWAAATSRLEAQGVVPGTYRTVVIAPNALGGRARFDPTQPGALHGLLAQMPTQATPVIEQRRDAVDARLVELLTRLFETMQTDPDLAEAARAPIARLQGAALRVAMVDKGLLDAHDHPVWQLVDRIAFAAAAYPLRGDPRAEVVTAAAQAAVDEATQAGAPSATDFRRALAVLDARLATQWEAEKAGAQVAIGSLEQKEQRAFLQQQFAERLATQSASVKTTPTMRAFVTQTWAAVLAEAWLRHGEADERTQTLVQTVDDLLWSLAPPLHPKSRQRLVALLPGLLQKLNRGLDLIVLPADERAAVFDELMVLHTAALKPRFKGDEELTPQQIVQKLREEVVSTLPPKRPFADSVIDIASMETVPMDFLPTRPGEPDDAPARRVETLKPGDRRRLFVEGRWQHVQLLWRGDRAGHFLFAGELAGRTHPITRRALERLAAAGLLKPVEERPLVERSVELMLRRHAPLG